MELLQRLWAIARDEAQRDNVDVTSALGDIGLFLAIPPINYGYDSTPINTLTFAHTGGDGTHFGLLMQDGIIGDRSPVVMTVPMMFEKPNVIVGENLLEFLSLGCQAGFFHLEQLLYDKEQAIRNIECPQNWAAEIKTWVDDKEAYGFDAAYREIGFFLETLRQRRNLLDVLTVQFSLHPWSQVESRFKELERTYNSKIEMAISKDFC